MMGAIFDNQKHAHAGVRARKNVRAGGNVTHFASAVIASTAGGMGEA